MIHKCCTELTAFNVSLKIEGDLYLNHAYLWEVGMFKVTSKAFDAEV